MLDGVSSVMVGICFQVPSGNVVSIASSTVDNDWHRSCESSQLARVSVIRSFKNIRSASDRITSGKSCNIDVTGSSGASDSIRAPAKICS